MPIKGVVALYVHNSLNFKIHKNKALTAMAWNMHALKLLGKIPKM